jgi:hypothetical protein
VEYVFSPDGFSVYYLTPERTISAGSFNTGLLTEGFTATTGKSGSLSVMTYNVGFSGAGGGGAEIKALYNLEAPLARNQSLQWVQVVSTNDPISGNPFTTLDNAANPSTPFYSYTIENRNPNLPANELNFYDFSQRPPAHVSSINPLTWSADLYPVIWNTATNSLTVENGMRWGWTAMGPTAYTTSEQAEINEAALFGPTQKATEMTFIDLSHIGDDFGNYGVASGDLTLPANQLFLDSNRYLADWNAAQPDIALGVSTPGGPSVIMPPEFVLNIINDALATRQSGMPNPNDQAFGGAIKTYAGIDSNFLLLHHA